MEVVNSPLLDHVLLKEDAREPFLRFLNATLNLVQLSGVPGSRMDPVQSNALVVRSPCSEFAVNQIVVAMEQSQNKWIATLNHAASTVPGSHRAPAPQRVVKASKYTLDGVIRIVSAKGMIPSGNHAHLDPVMKMISLFGGHLGLAGLSVQKLVVLVFRPGLEDALVRKILATDKTIKIKRGLARRELVLYNGVHGRVAQDRAVWELV